MEVFGVDTTGKITEVNFKLFNHIITRGMLSGGIRERCQ